METVITYGTFDLFHIGHLNILESLSKLGDRLIVGVSTDEFNKLKGKQCVFGYEERSRIVESIGCVDEVFPENKWEQKVDDIIHYGASVFGMGNDWKGEFDDLTQYCEVVYLPRTKHISTTDLKKALSGLDIVTINRIKDGLDDVLDIVKAIA